MHCFLANRSNDAPGRRTGGRQQVAGASMPQIRKRADARFRRRETCEAVVQCLVVGDKPDPEGLKGSLRCPAVDGQVSSLLLRRAKQFSPEKALRPPE